MWTNAKFELRRYMATLSCNLHGVRLFISVSSQRNPLLASIILYSSKTSTSEQILRPKAVTKSGSTNFEA